MAPQDHSPTPTVRLATYDGRTFHPGRSRLWQAAWFFLGLPVLRCSWLPSSGLRVRLLRVFGAHIGKGVVIKPGVRVKFPWRLSVGNDCWLGEDCWIDNLGFVTLGHDVCVSQGAYFCTGNHDWSDPAFRETIRPITLEDGSWVGAKAVLAPGVTVGRNAVAAAGSVVLRSLPPDEIHAGNPACFQRRRCIRTQAGRAISGAAPEARAVEA